MSRTPSMFGTFAVTVDGRGELHRSVDALHQRHEPRCTATAEDMVSDFCDDGLVHLPAPSARLAFSPTLDTSISPTSSNFSPSTSSGYSIPSPDSVSTPSDPDDAWNLIPYNVSWGHEYEEYRAGILPGPEGDCIFLRSPTPLRNQRASEACKKCRERKAKCTGTRPSCARCASRDYVCEYASEATSESTNNSKARRPRRETRESAHRDTTSPSTPDHSIKTEIPDFMSLQYPDHASSYWEASTPSDDYPMEEPWQFHHNGILPGAAGHSLVGQSSAVPTQSQPLVAPLPAHSDVQTAGVHAQIQLPVYVQPELKYEQGVAFGLHSYDPNTVYHAGQDYSISMQPLDADFNASGFSMHIPATKLAYNGFTPQYVNYLSS
ncbi:hypothetical protein B0F90DRAFT_1713404 [Multifurca ochricompacta]|uniref:Zn(2)-C6 fungal-type domain-containing protein n=1 Tax=Multifurca ochricompacta TaxID=376703 RepID=A0AAD4M5H2_9AGAM|nr:hypothetical protein B0F90DRAFT_1713404 [Multifurca ochricompacta]